MASVLHPDPNDALGPSGSDVVTKQDGVRAPSDQGADILAHCVNVASCIYSSALVDNSGSIFHHVFEPLMGLMPIPCYV